MNIFLTGGSGFVGRALCRELIQRGYRLRCLVRSGSSERLPDSPLIEPVSGNLFSNEELTPLMEGADAVIHLVGIIREFPRRGITFERLHYQATATVVGAARQVGIQRFLHMSANGSRENAQTKYHRTKWRAEEEVRNSGLDWTIFRPSLIYGAEDQFINLIATMIRSLPLIPVIGDGEYRMQPVAVELIAKGFASALEERGATGKTYHCGGADCLSYNQLLDLVAAALGKKSIRKLHQPLALMRPLVGLLQHLPPFPITSDQLQMLLEGNCCDTSAWREELGLEPASLQEGLGYLKPD
jgi:NADH dehydrogenase